jgi:hypothetical protein
MSEAPLELKDVIPSSPDRDSDTDDDEASSHATKYQKTDSGKVRLKLNNYSENEDEQTVTNSRSKTSRKISHQSSASNGFNLYQLENKDELVALVPDNKRTGTGWFNKIASKAWSDLPESEKNEYRSRCITTSGYKLFCAEHIKSVKKNNKKGKTSGNQSRKMVNMWKELSEKEQQEYNQRAMELAEKNQAKSKKKEPTDSEDVLPQEKDANLHLLVRAIVKGFISHAQYKQMRPYVLAKSEDFEVSVLLHMIKTCLDLVNDGQAWWDNYNGKDFVTNLVKVLEQDAV